MRLSFPPNIDRVGYLLALRIKSSNCFTWDCLFSLQLENPLSAKMHKNKWLLKRLCLRWRILQILLDPVFPSWEIWPFWLHRCFSVCNNLYSRSVHEQGKALQWLVLPETRCNARKGGLPYKKGDGRHLIKGVQIERFHMTSRRPYWCSKTMNRRPCWCTQKILWELNSFLM